MTLCEDQILRSILIGAEDELSEDVVAIAKKEALFRRVIGDEIGDAMVGILCSSSVTSIADCSVSVGEAVRIYERLVAACNPSTVNSGRARRYYGDTRYCN